MAYKTIKYGGNKQEIRNLQRERHKLMDKIAYTKVNLKRYGEKKEELEDEIKFLLIKAGNNIVEKGVNKL